MESACTLCKFSSIFIGNCSQNIPICTSNFSSLKPATLNERESKSTKESQERLSAGVLSTQYLTATVISSIHRSTVDVPFKDNTYLTGFQFSYHL